MAKEAESFFTPEQEKRIVETIREAETHSSGEIRVHLDNSTEGSEWNTAVNVFMELRMQNTAFRNAVLFHIRVLEKTFSVVADVGINNKVPENFWDDIITEMKKSFGEGMYFEGLREAILSTGKALKEYFPYTIDDKNELSDEITQS